MSGRLQNKIAIVTGASSGIGRATCFAYAAEGARLVCADLREVSHFDANAQETTGTTHDLINKDNNDRAIFVRCDVTKPEQVETLVQRAVEWGGRLDIMVNCAGISLEGGDLRPVWDVPLATWDTTNAVNSTGVFYGTRYASKQMVAQTPHEPSGDRGWIINIASVLGMVGGWHTSAYCASKGAVVNFTRAAAIDCGPHRVHVNAICPGYAASAMTQPLFSQPAVRKGLVAKHPFGERLGEPRDLAAACVFLASEDARWVSGACLPVDGGYTAL